MAEATATTFASQQRGVLTGMAGGFAASLIVIIGGHFVYPPSVPVSDAVPDRLTCYLPYLALMAAPLIVAIGDIARHRFLDPETIDGAVQSADPAFSRKRAVLQNHVEQAVLAVMVHFALLACLPYDWLNIVPLMAVWWTITRFVFASTYSRGAASRAFGFAASFYPNIVGALCVPVLLVTNALG